MLQPKNLLIILSVLILTNCTDKKEQKIKYKNHNISFLNASIQLPENYNKISLEKYRELLKNSTEDSLFTQNKQVSIEKFKSDHSDYVMFCDNENIDNNLTIVPFYGLEISEKTKESLKEYIIRSMKGREYSENLKYKIIQSKLIDNRIIKIKGEIKYNNKPEINFYSTQYMIKGRNVEFSINVYNENGIDFEKEITEIKYN